MLKSRAAEAALPAAASTAGMLRTAMVRASVAASAANTSRGVMDPPARAGGYVLPRLSPLRPNGENAVQNVAVEIMNSRYVATIVQRNNLISSLIAVRSACRY